MGSPDHEGRCREPDGCVVPTAPLASILQDFVSNWRRTRPSSAGQRGAAVLEPVGPYDWLAADSGLTVAEVRSARWPNRKPTTELRIADALVASIGADPGLFYEGAPLEPRPNPRAPRERQAECCSGSTFDALTG